ncbi:NEL-type E3 ubiquitin ligase domain-containing protein [Pseudomonas sp. Marseille-P9899]|uniref:NEL-type E3 ubiquitin ligase domain-containing protein n=1 Tax=Pseudomonas sp. Marseille-P9899 TaxID=2730401 RepID=UPI001588FD54|nr:NEL-type E3 ubiquitin ligase domain-containing protein [Pseudomonas sp. Marseille-P9899]
MDDSHASATRTPPPSARHDVWLESIGRNVPDWLLNAPQATRQTLRSAGRNVSPWIDTALRDKAQVSARVREAYAQHHHHEAQVNALLARLPSIEAFAEPLLKAGISRRFGLDLDVRSTYLFHAGRVHLDDSFAAASRDPVVANYNAMRLATQSLLHAALQNFEAWETAASGMASPAHDSMIYAASSATETLQGDAVAIVPEQFAALCRTLDLGGQYQALIDSVLAGSSTDSAAQAPTGETPHRLLENFERSAFLLQLHLAYLKGDISERLYDAVRSFSDGQASADASLVSGFLGAWDVELKSIVVIGNYSPGSLPTSYPRWEGLNHDEPLVVYIPDDPFGPFKEFASFAQFVEALRDRLREPDYLKFFQRFVPARHSAELFGILQRTFHPKVWNSGGWYEQGQDDDALLKLVDLPFGGNVFSRLVQQKIAALKDDALFHAVPTADEDHKSLMEKLRYFGDVAFAVLNVAGFVVPGLGAVMMAVAAVQLSYEVFEGIDSLVAGEREQAWEYLMDVVENLALMAALGGASSGAGIPALEVPSAVGRMRPVRLPDGTTRLWTPDLAPFAHDTVLPAGLTPDAQGLYHFQGKQWLPLEGRLYSVKNGESGSYLEHPQRADAYRPAVRHNTAGAWLHELDQPLEWEGLTLFRRLGAEGDELSDEAARRALYVSDTHEAQLRRALVEGQRPPALLSDTVERFRLDQLLGTVGEGISRAHRAQLLSGAYERLNPVASEEAHVFKRSFASLPGKVIEELLAHANAAELEIVRDEQKIPLRLAGEARAYLQKVRLARAYEGLFLRYADNPDSDRLILHSLARLPGWSPAVRLEVRAMAFDGELLDSIGPADAPVCRVLIENAEGFRVHGAPPAPAAVDLYGGVLAALPAPQREALALLGEDPALALKLKVQAQPLLSRQELRSLLKMQPLRPAARSPMRLADGRPGYPLSGRGVLPGYISEDTLLDKIRLLELEDAHAEDILRDLYSVNLNRAAISERLDVLVEEHRELSASLAEWASASPDAERLASRERIGEALWAHWRSNALPEIGRNRRPLQLRSISVDDFPEHLPAFVYERVRALELEDLTAPALRVSVEANGIVQQEQQLSVFLQRFPVVRSLSLDRGTGWPANELPQIVMQSFPWLRNLRLANQQLTVNQGVFDDFRAMRGLRRLDLSGNPLDVQAVMRLNEPQLDFLGLDNMGLTRWPTWLDSQALENISELSLADNHLTELPEPMLHNQGNSVVHTQVFLRGNVLSRQTIFSVRLSEGVGRRFSFDLDVPAALQAELDVCLAQTRLLNEAMGQWRETSGSAQPQDEQQARDRWRISEAILDFWNECIQSFYTPLLRLDGVAFADVPLQLPDFFYEHVRRLDLLRPSGTAEELDRLLLRFPQLEELSISSQAVPMTALPQALLQLRELRTLALTNQQLVIDQSVIDFISGLPELWSLELDGNTLGTITDVSGLSMRYLNMLSLAGVGMQTWPDWLSALVPRQVQVLSLDNNLLTQLPEYLLQNRRNLDESSEISLLNNPLSYDTLLRAFISESGHRPFVFRMDIPEAIRRLPVAPHSSDSDQFAGPGEHSPSTSDSSEGDYNSFAPWLTENTDENEARIGIWQQLERAEDAPDLLRLIGQLRFTADYRTAAARPELVGRVWRVLEACAQDGQLRVALNGMAQEPLQLLRNYDTCPDGIRLEFNQMEVQVFTQQSLRDVPPQQRGPALYRLVRRLYRLQELDTIAREQAGTRDEAEVRLAYRLHWAGELDLPLPPGHMLFRPVADLQPGELQRALVRVQQGEGGQAFRDYAAQRDFWVAYLRETYAERFSALREMFQARVLELLDLYPDDEPARASERVRTLEMQLQSDELNLIHELTNHEGLELV